MAECKYGVWENEDHEGISPYEWWGKEGADICCMLAYQGKEAASYATSLVNLVVPGTYDLNPIVAPAWAAGTGWTFTGSEYFDTGYTPTPNGTYIAQFADMTGGADLGLCGAEIDLIDPWRRVCLAKHDDGAYFGNGAQECTVGPTHINTGNYAVADIDCFIDGAFHRTISYDLPDWSASASTLFLGAYSYAGTAWTFMLGKIRAFAAYSCKLTRTQIAAVATEMSLL